MIRSYYAMIISVGVACAVFISSADLSRANIVWQDPETISGDGDVSTLGDLVRAWSSAGTATVNGVSFFSNASLGPSGNNSGGPGFGGASTVFAGLSGSYRALLDSATFNVQFGTFTINLQNLTVGSTYEFQAFVNDSRNNQEGPGGNGNRWNVFDSGTGTAQSKSVLQPYIAGNGNIGQHIKGTFIATSSLQVIRILGVAERGPNVALINAYQLRNITAVPEPSSLQHLLSAMGFVGILTRKRLRN